MKKKLLFRMLPLVLVLALGIVIAAPAMAWWEASTMVNIQGPEDPVPAGSSVSLTITETNNGDPAYWISDVWVSLEPGDYVLNKASDYYAGGDMGDDGIMDVGETWEWIVPVIVNEDTMFTAIGHGFAKGRPYWDVTYDEDVRNDQGDIAFPDEKFELWVYVTPPGKGRWTGGGTIDTAAIIPTGGVRVTHGFEFHNDLDKPNNLQVNWGGNRFHMTELLVANCFMNYGLPLPDPPAAPVNEVIATGVGKYNGVKGYTINYHFTDVGEPGLNDYASIIITAPDGTVVLQVEGSLTHGNHQAHPDKDKKDKK